MSQDFQNTPNPYAAPNQPPMTGQPIGYAPGAQNQGDQTGGLIPYKNPQALIAYYLGLFSLFPLIGLFLAVPAFILGIRGLIARNRNPVIKGSVHAWIGILFGGAMTLLWGLTWVLVIIGIVASANR